MHTACLTGWAVLAISQALLKTYLGLCCWEG